ncbi:MAG: DedA family protein [Betaproteobacteria bacterium]|nr:DedA family protein [Betaproteobacteria bacterium]
MSTSLENALAAALAWFALPQFGLSTVFITAFVSATLLPMGSEPVVFGYVKLHPEQFWLTIAVATLGNTLGGAVDYWMGRGAQSAAKVLIFSWLPIVGDPLCAVAGWLRLAFWPCLAWIAIGKCLRYVTMTWLLMEIPDQFWKSLLP